LKRRGKQDNERKPLQTDINDGKMTLLFGGKLLGMQLAAVAVSEETQETGKTLNTGGLIAGDWRCRQWTLS